METQLLTYARRCTPLIDRGLPFSQLHLPLEPAFTWIRILQTLRSSNQHGILRRCATQNACSLAILCCKSWRQPYHLDKQHLPSSANIQCVRHVLLSIRPFSLAIHLPLAENHSKHRLMGASEILPFGNSRKGQHLFAEAAFLLHRIYLSARKRWSTGSRKPVRLRPISILYWTPARHKSTQVAPKGCETLLTSAYHLYWSNAFGKVISHRLRSNLSCQMKKANRRFPSFVPMASLTTPQSA